MTVLRSCLLILMLLAFWAPPALAQERPVEVLWFDANPGYPGQTAAHRRAMADYLTAFGDGAVFRSTFVSSTRGGALAAALDPDRFDVLVIDVTDRRSRFTTADTGAIRNRYLSGRRAIMLDGSLWIRSIDNNPTTAFPGIGGATGGLLVNQVKALADAGGGILIGTDHNEFQIGANDILQAMIPGARFTGLTIPSTDGSFIGRTLLGHAVAVRPASILEHWQTIPSQGEVPVGTFTDFLGQPVTLHNLVETSDQPGGRQKRPYISASFDPGEARTAIDAEEAMDLAPLDTEETALPDTMPTRKGPPG